MIVEIAFLLIGTFLVLKGSEWITDSVSVVAGQLRTTNVAVALVLVSFLFSLPELMITILSIMKGYSDIGLGTALGSVIVNLGLGLGMAAMIKPIKIPRHVVVRDGIFMLIVTIIVTIMIIGNGAIKQTDGLILFLLYIPYIVNIYVQERMLAKQEKVKESYSITKTLELFGKLGVDEIKINGGKKIMVIGAVLTLLGAELFTRGLIGIGNIFHISNLLLGLTIGAISTSIPNIVAAVQAAKKGYDEIAVTETIGSNIFTLLITIGILAMSNSVHLDPLTGIITAPVLLLVSVLVFISMLTQKLTRSTGLALVMLFIIATLLEVVLRSYV